MSTLYLDETRRRFHLLKAVMDNNQQSHVLNLVSQREHIIDWMVDWCWTYDPRNVSMGLPSTLPWIPWPKQVDFIDWLYTIYTERVSGLAEKSRDAGATWLVCLFILHEWRWVHGFSAGVGSNKLDNVDKKDNPGSIFAKIRFMQENQPAFWMPKGWKQKDHDKLANMVNPENGNNIIGQGGDEIGRGDRRSFYFVDEASHLEHPKKVDAALSETTDTQLDVGTPNGMNNFGQKRHSGRVQVFTFSWRHDPRKNEDWYERRKAELDSAICAQELDLDYQASVEGACIDPKWVQAAIGFKFKDTTPRTMGLDVAAGGKNKSAIAIRKGISVKVRAMNIGNGIDLAFKAVEEGEREGIEYLNFDRIGVGHAVQSAMERNETELTFKPFGVIASDSASDVFYPEYGKHGYEIFLNARAEWWINVARRFEKTWEHVTGVSKYPEEELISIENDGNLINQFSAPKKMRTENGRIKVESKDSMIARGVQSPDEADAVIMAFIPQKSSVRMVLPDFDTIKMVSKDPPASMRFSIKGIAMRVNGPRTTAIFFKFNPSAPLLYIYDEYVERDSDPGRHAACMWVKMGGRLPKVAVSNISLLDKADKDLAKPSIAGQYKKHKLLFLPCGENLQDQITRSNLWIRKGWVAINAVKCIQTVSEGGRWRYDSKGLTPILAHADLAQCLINAIDAAKIQDVKKPTEITMDFFKSMDGKKNNKPATSDTSDWWGL